MFLGFAMAAAATAGPVIDADGVDTDRRLPRSAPAALAGWHRQGEQRSCFYDSLTDPAEPRTTCRTRADWQRLGLDRIVD